MTFSTRKSGTCPLLLCEKASAYILDLRAEHPCPDWQLDEQQFLTTR